MHCVADDQPTLVARRGRGTPTTLLLGRLVSEALPLGATATTRTRTVRVKLLESRVNSENSLAITCATDIGPRHDPGVF